ncbi:hypothetical protein BGZ54_003059 [Gamsiella multidivaricata]|nr:hypothetical protein BGZ54_003059 [Gamsiella multidivaricata]
MSSNSTTSKEHEKFKVEKMKGLENYRVAKAQSKKFVIPGIVVLLSCMFVLFGVVYGSTGSELERSNGLPDGLPDVAKIVKEVFDGIPLLQELNSEASQERLANRILEILAEMEGEGQYGAMVKEIGPEAVVA